MSVAEVCLYDLRTTHVRHQPFERAFRYRLFQILFDIDALPALAQRLRLFSYNRPNLFAFFDRDHGVGDGSPLRPWVERMLAEVDVRLDGGPIRLLCFPRVAGYVFNPLSVFFGYGPDGALRGVVYEVDNTFGETHAYAAPMAGGRHAADKRFHVSPFFDVAGRYQFRLRPPGERFSLSVRTLREGAPEHTATLFGRARPLSDARLLAAFAKVPFVTAQVIAAIHWEALWIWLKGARYRPKPPPPLSPVTKALGE